MPEIGGSKIHPISAPNHPLSTSSFISKSDLSIFRFFPQEGPCFWLRLPRRGDKKGILPFSSCPSFFFSLQRPFKNGPALSFVLGSPRSLGKMLELDHSSLSFPPTLHPPRHHLPSEEVMRGGVRRKPSRLRAGFAKQ